MKQKTLACLLVACVAGGVMSLSAAEFKNGTSFGLGTVPEELVVERRAGEPVRFSLEENPSTGYKWEVESNTNECDVALEHRGGDGKATCGAPGKLDVVVTSRIYTPARVEFRYRRPVIFPTDVVIAISQSGETADTLAAVNLAREAGAFLFGICNVVGSSIARATDTGCYTHIGPEIGVASTKAFTAQVTTLFLIAMSLAEQLGTVSAERRTQLVTELQRIPDKIAKILEHDEQIAALAKIFTYTRNFLYLGRGYNYPVALEGALKLKEISYIHAEGYPAAEMKHGPIALIDEEMPVVVIAPRRGNYEKILSNIQEVKARKGRIISVVTEGDVDVKALSDWSFEIPDTEECFEPILSIIPLQLLAYHIAIAKGRDVDQPRNLAKSVTVE